MTRRSAPGRRSIWLKGFDYASPGAYFVTLCMAVRQTLWGEIDGGVIQLSQFGQIAAEELVRTSALRAEVSPDEWVIMPNHLHMVVVIRLDSKRTAADAPHVEATADAPLRRPPRSLGSFVAGFKSAVTVRINMLRGTPGAPVWQRNYYEHIMRNDAELAAIRRYIRENPARWDLDRDNLNNSRRLPPPMTARDYLNEVSAPAP